MIIVKVTQLISFIRVRKYIFHLVILVFQGKLKATQNAIQCQSIERLRMTQHYGEKKFVVLPQCVELSIYP